MAKLVDTQNKSIEELKNLDAEITRAIYFMVNTCLNKNGNQRPLRTTKPLVMHSLRVAFKLLGHGYDGETIVVAVLHDLLEDADVKTQTIRKKFGKKVVGIVAACTFDNSIKDSIKKYKELFGRTCTEGKNALIVKGADIFDNSHYFQFAEDTETKNGSWRNGSISYRLLKRFPTSPFIVN